MKPDSSRRGWPRSLFAADLPSLSLLLLLVVTFAYFFPRWSDWNQNSRIDLVVSLVDHGTAAIDRYVDNTGDYAFYQGHYYSDKAPGMALLGVPVYALYRAILTSGVLNDLTGAASSGSALSDTLREGGQGLTPDRVNLFLALVVVSFATVVVPSVATCFLVYLMAGWLGLSRGQSWMAACLYGLATSAFPYSNTFVGHQTSAFLLFSAFVLVLLVRRSSVSTAWLPLAGLMIGYAAVTEYPTVVVGAVLALWALATLGRPLNTAVRLLAGAAPALLLLAVYDWVVFGTLLPIGYGHSSLWSEVHGIGFMSLTYPSWDALVGLTFGSYRGLFFLSPFLLFAIPGYLLLWRWRERPGGLPVLVFSPLLLLLLYSSSAMWQGGFSVGPRYLVPALPFLALPAAVGMAGAWRSPWGRPVVLVAALWSFFAVWAETIAGQSFPDYTHNPLWDFSLPRLAAGDIGRNAGMLLGLRGWASLLPLLATDLVLVLVAFRTLPATRGQAVAGGHLAISFPGRGEK